MSRVRMFPPAAGVEGMKKFVIDAVAEAARFGINSHHAVNFENDRAGTRLNYQVLSNAVGCARKASSAEAMAEMFEDEKTLAPIREDYKKRHRK